MWCRNIKDDQKHLEKQSLASIDPVCVPLHPSLPQNNIEPCPECGHLKQKHILCGFCYAKVCKETSMIRHQIQAMEGGPLKAPTVETVVLYEGEIPKEQDKDKRIVERPRKRPAWFNYWSCVWHIPRQTAYFSLSGSVFLPQIKN